MQPPPNEWPSSGTDTVRGVLFVAQHMREMLTQSSFESFRVVTLDISSKLRELMTVAGEVEAGHLPINALDPVLKEVAKTLRMDPIIAERISGEANLFCDYVKSTDIKKVDVPYIVSFCRLILKRIGEDYGGAIEAKILDCYFDSSARDSLRQSCSAYCAYLVNSGYNKSYLLDAINDRFFRNDIRKVETRTLQRFFSGLSKSDKLFRVWISAPATTANFIAKLKLTDLTVSASRQLPADVRAAYLQAVGATANRRYISIDVEAKDPISAAMRLFQKLSSISSFIILGRQEIELSWDHQAYVRTPRAITGAFIERKPVPLLGAIRSAHGLVANSIRSSARRAFSDFDEKSTERVLSAVDTAALARSSPNLENHLISLWSAIEVLLSNPPSGVPRIVHYVDLLAPCICHKYVRRYIVATYDGFAKYYRRQLGVIERSMALPGGMDDYTRFTHICFDPAFQAQQSELLAMLTDNPLALHRLWKLEKNFASPKAYINSVNEHEQRVRWQLHRIYRTRNQLVHVGSVPVYLEPLVFNMLEYFRSTIGPLLGRASKEDEYADIDQLVSEIGIEYDVTKQKAAGVKAAKFAPVDYPFFFR